MTARGDRERITAEIPPEAKQAVKDDDENMWEAITDAIMMKYGLADVETEEAFRTRIERIEQRIQNLQSQKEEVEEEIATLEQDREDEQRALEQYLNKRETIETIQNRILETLEGTSLSVRSQSADLREIARREYGHETDENINKVISDLRARAEERGREVSDSQFSEGTVGSVRSEGGRFDGLKSVGGSDD